MGFTCFTLKHLLKKQRTRILFVCVKFATMFCFTAKHWWLLGCCQGIYKYCKCLFDWLIHVWFDIWDEIWRVDSLSCPSGGQWCIKNNGMKKEITFYFLTATTKFSTASGSDVKSTSRWPSRISASLWKLFVFHFSQCILSSHKKTNSLKSNLLFRCYSINIKSHVQ